MFSIRRAFAVFAVISFVIFFALSPSLAAVKAPSPVEADFANNPVLASIAKLGAKLYYLGNRNGLEGWFIVKDGRVQIAYATPDKKAVVIGAMFGDDGESISSTQVKTLLENNKEIVSQLTTAATQTDTSTSNDSAKASPPVSPVSPAIAPSVATQTSPPSALSPGERLYQQLSSATGVTLGNATPRIYMIMDANCPHCQATWRLLRDSVKSNVVQLRMIPIAAPESDSERAAVQLLRSPDPLNVWDKYVGAAPGQGDKSQLSGNNDAAMVTALRANHAMTDSWHIDQTPYLVYRGKDGKVKIVVGEPDKLSAILGDVAP